MLDPKYIKENPDKVKKAMKNRGLNADKIIDKIIYLGKQMIVEQEGKNKLKKLSEEIANLEGEERAVKIAEVKKTKERVNNGGSEKERQRLLAKLPNIPRDDVKVGNIKK